MVNIEKLFKHKILFTPPREICNYREGRKVKFSGTYKSNTIYNHKKIGVTDMDELLTQIKPFLYYLGSKDVNREGDGYIFETDLLVGLFWKYKNSNDEYDYKYIQIGGVHINNIGSELSFDTFYPRGDVDYRELENPFEIHIYVHQEYNLLIVGAEEEEEVESDSSSDDEDDEEEPFCERLLKYKIPFYPKGGEDGKAISHGDDFISIRN